MKPFDTIITAIDFSENSEFAFDYALMLAKQFQAELTVMHVINEPVDLRGFYVPNISFEQLEQEIAEGARTMMDKFCQARMHGFTNYQSTILTGIPYEEIIRKAAETNASLIVLGTHGRSGLDRILFGST